MTHQTNKTQAESSMMDTTTHSDILAGSRGAALYNAILQLSTVEECEAFFEDLCTPAEIDALKERWLIARLLDAGRISYRDISARTGASTTTIGRVARFLTQESNKGYRLILDRLKSPRSSTDAH